MKRILLLPATLTLAAACQTSPEQATLKSGEPTVAALRCVRIGEEQSPSAHTATVVADSSVAGASYRVEYAVGLLAALDKDYAFLKADGTYALRTSTDGADPSEWPSDGTMAIIEQPISPPVYSMIKTNVDGSQDNYGCTQPE